jgi:hypothetical protein
MENRLLCNGFNNHCVQQSTIANTLTFPAGSSLKPSFPRDQSPAPHRSFGDHRTFIQESVGVVDSVSKESETFVRKSRNLVLRVTSHHSFISGHSTVSRLSNTAAMLTEIGEVLEKFQLKTEFLYCHADITLSQTRCLSNVLYRVVPLDFAIRKGFAKRLLFVDFRFI